MTELGILPNIFWIGGFPEEEYEGDFMQSLHEIAIDQVLPIYMGCKARLNVLDAEKYYSFHRIKSKWKINLKIQ